MTNTIVRIGRRVRHHGTRIGDGARGRTRVHFLHIGKTGGTAIKAAWGAGEVVTGTHRLVLHGHGFTLGDVPDSEMAAFVVRDPVARYVSAFNSRLRQGRPRYDQPWSDGERMLFAEFPTPDALATALADPDPDTRKFAASAMRTIKHVRDPLQAYLGDAETVVARCRNILTVGRQSDLQAASDRLAERIGARSVALPSDERSAHRSPAGMETALSDAGERAVRDWYAEDYRIIDVLDRVDPGPPTAT